jgi:SnoaL-like domain
MRTATKLAEDYITVWNERDETQRLNQLVSTWTSDASYADPLMRGSGRTEISALIAAVHARFPAFHFALAGVPDGFGDAVRFSWTLGPDGGETVIKGTDFVRRDGDLIASVTGFLDQLPVGT